MNGLCFNRIGDYLNIIEKSIKKKKMKNASLKRVPKPLGLASPKTRLPKTLESGSIEMLMGHAPSRRIVAKIPHNLESKKQRSPR
jgi:hypothetical protein